MPITEAQALQVVGLASLKDELSAFRRRNVLHGLPRSHGESGARPAGRSRVTAHKRMKNIEVGSVGTKRLVVLAQLSTLAALAMGLQFLFNTTGGTLFLFASVAPVLVMVSIVIVLV